MRTYARNSRVNKISGSNTRKNRTQRPWKESSTSSHSDQRQYTDFQWNNGSQEHIALHEVDRCETTANSTRSRTRNRTHKFQFPGCERAYYRRASFNKHMRIRHRSEWNYNGKKKDVNRTKILT